MPTVTVHCKGQKITIPLLECQLRLYDGHYGQGTFKWLCRTTARRPISMNTIANKLGVTLQAVSAFYCHYVKPHIPEAMRVNKLVKPSKPKRLSLPINLVPLAKRAANHGLAARPIAQKDDGACRRSISINGWICRVLRTKPNHPGGYAGLTLSASTFKNHDFFIITLRQVDKPPIYYVIPVAEFRRLFNSWTTLEVYIPTKSHKTQRPRAIDWDRYRSAWHLLNKRR